MSPETRRGVCVKHLMNPSYVILSTLAHECNSGAEDFQISFVRLPTRSDTEKAAENGSVVPTLRSNHSHSGCSAKSLRPWKVDRTSSLYCFELPTSGCLTPLPANVRFSIRWLVMKESVCGSAIRLELSSASRRSWMLGGVGRRRADFNIGGARQRKAKP
jgi:hypothetical protein